MRLPLLLDNLLVRLGGSHGQPLGQEIITRIATGHLHHLAAAPEFIDVFPQYDVHYSSGLNLRREWQQCDVAGLLDRVGQTALARSTNPGDASRDNLAALGDEPV